MVTVHRLPTEIRNTEEIIECLISTQSFCVAPPRDKSRSTTQAHPVLKVAGGLIQPIKPYTQTQRSSGTFSGIKGVVLY